MQTRKNLEIGQIIELALTIYKYYIVNKKKGHTNVFTLPKKTRK